MTLQSHTFPASFYNVSLRMSQDVSDTTIAILILLEDSKADLQINRSLSINKEKRDCGIALTDKSSRGKS